MKFEKETDLCVAATEVLLGLSVSAGMKLVAIAEVPWGCGSNEQFDMLLLDIKKEKYLCIEYKLSDLKSLENQVHRMSGRGIGIINREKVEEQKYTNYFSYTGKDSEIEELGEKLFHGYSVRYKWTDIYVGHGLKYYWAFKDCKDNLNGGTPGGKKMMLADLYIQAIVNLHKHYGKLDFMVTHAILGEGYSVSTSKKYYRKAIK